MICRKARGTSAVRLGLLFAGLSLLFSASGFRAQDQDPGWPRDIQVSQGTITIYQPQPESLKANILSGRGATSFLKTGGATPVFGVFWFEGRLDVDRDSRTAQLNNVQITRVRFPEATPDQEQRYIELVSAEIARWPRHPISMDRLMTSLAASEQEVKSEDALKNDPPKILITEGAAVLVLYDGPPTLRDIPDTKLQRVDPGHGLVGEGLSLSGPGPARVRPRRPPQGKVGLRHGPGGLRRDRPRGCSGL